MRLCKTIWRKNNMEKSINFNFSIYIPNHVHNLHNILWITALLYKINSSRKIFKNFWHVYNQIKIWPTNNSDFFLTKRDSREEVELKLFVFIPARGFRPCLGHAHISRSWEINDIAWETHGGVTGARHVWCRRNATRVSGEQNLTECTWHVRRVSLAPCAASWCDAARCTRNENLIEN